MAGFSLYVSNTTSKDDGHLCFHEIQNAVGTPSEDQRIQCPFHARYVIYYNERRPEVVYPSYYSEFAYSELCEVEVYGKINRYQQKKKKRKNRNNSFAGKKGTIHSMSINIASTSGQ